MKKVRYILILTLLAVVTWGCPVSAQSQNVTTEVTAVDAAKADAASSEVALAETAEAPDVDVNEIVFGHINDAYWWHIVTLGDMHLSIPLPVIVKGTDGWHIFSSKHLEEKGEYAGFYLAKGGMYDGKLVMKDATGAEVRPLDLSITKNVLGMFINGLLLIVCILTCARWYKKHSVVEEAPRGGVGMMESLILMIYDDLIKECVGPDYRKYAPYLLTAFFFILISNLMGLVPIFPGGANVTGNIAVTFVLAVCTFIMTNVFGSKGYWKDVLWPDVPVWLKCPVPMMPLIEFFGLFTKPFALMVRLFANIMAGHAVILSLMAIIFITAKLGPMLNGTLTVISVAFAIFMTTLEVLVAFIQAYVFTMLSAVFIGLSRVKEEEE